MGTSEEGPELMFPNRGGFVANNKQTSELLSRAERARSLINTQAIRPSSANHAKADPQPINNYFTIYQTLGQSTQELATAIHREQERSRRSSLFDNGGAW